MDPNQNAAGLTPPPPPTTKAQTPPPGTVTKVAPGAAIVAKSLPDEQLAIVNDTVAKITELVDMKMIQIPSDYSIGNAMKAASLLIQDAKNKEGKPALQVCTKVSIANALYRMGVQALNPIKRQCSFVVMGDQLVCMTEYAGQVAMAKRYGMRSIVANVIYEKDKFEMEINSDTGLKRVIKHEHSYENVDFNAIKGAYAIVTMQDGTKFMDIMSMDQIRKAWEMGNGKGNTDAHKNFPDMMAKKTIESRISKAIINKSDDAVLMGISDTEEEEKIVIPKKTNAQLAANEEPSPVLNINIKANEVVEEAKPAVSTKKDQPF